MKKAKKAKIKFTKVENYISEYTCPHCHINIRGAGIKQNVTRFLCEQCNNEIIVEKETN